MNTAANTSYEINLNGLNLDGSKFNSATREEFILSSPGLGPPGKHQSTLSSLHILLNGAMLELGPSETLPHLHGKRVKGGYFVAPPRTYGFVVYPNASAQACM